MPNISAVLTAASITGTISAIRFDGYSIFLERDGNTNRLVARKGTDIQTLEWHDGERGLPGTDGVGITNVRKLGDSLEITMSDGHKYIIPNVRGANGMPGVPGKDGYTPIKGVDYFDGEPGYTPIKGVDYFDGRDGIDGKDGRDGTDAEVTSENITAALGYTPADVADLRSTITPVYTDGKGRYLNADGRIYTASKYATCDFIAVVPGMTLHLEGFRADNQKAVCAYNRAQELVKVLAVGQPAGYVIDEVLPDDAYFIRACTGYDSAAGEVTGTITGYLYGNVAELVVKHDAEIDAKQDTLVSGQTIKTINGESLLGEGNIVVQGGGAEKEWVLVGAITTDTKAQSLPVDLTQYSEMAIASDVSATGNGNLYANGGSPLINQFYGNGTRKGLTVYKDEAFGIVCYSSRYGTNDWLVNYLNGVSASNKHFGDIRSLKLSHPDVIVTCEVRIYAR